MIEIKVPVLPESISEATVAQWHKKPGDLVQVDDVIVEIETDKVVLEVPAEEAGVFTKIIAQEGETVGAQQILGIMNEDAEVQDSELETSKSESEAEVATEEQTETKSKPQIENKTGPVATKKSGEPQETIVTATPVNSPHMSTPKTPIVSIGNRMEER